MKQQQKDDLQKRDTVRLAPVIPLRPLHVPAPSVEEPPPAARRLPRSRRLWGREDGFTMSGSRI